MLRLIAVAVHGPHAAILSIPIEHRLAKGEEFRRSQTVIFENNRPIRLLEYPIKPAADATFEPHVHVGVVTVDRAGPIDILSDGPRFSTDPRIRAMPDPRPVSHEEEVCRPLRFYRSKSLSRRARPVEEEVGNGGVHNNLRAVSTSTDL
jgi:hypothetical protein